MMRAKKESKAIARVSDILLESTRILIRGLFDFWHFVRIKRWPFSEKLSDGEQLPALDIGAPNYA
jgi:hypothetical protein